jgi:hypothetical protein
MTALPRLLPALAATALLLACSQAVRLTETDRAALDDQPAIHVLHYETPLPHIKTFGPAAPPAAAAVRRAAGADPAALVAASFARLLGKKEKLKNLRVEKRHLPRPVAKSATAHKQKYKRGLALELWTDDWAFEAIPGEPGQYGMRFVLRSRLARLDDGRVLWSSGQCRTGGGNLREYKLAAADLTRGTRLRKLLANVRDECARQLLRDFYDAPAAQAKTK